MLENKRPFVQNKRPFMSRTIQYLHSAKTAAVSAFSPCSRWFKERKSNEPSGQFFVLVLDLRVWIYSLIVRAAVDITNLSSALSFPILDICTLKSFLGQRSWEVYHIDSLPSLSEYCYFLLSVTVRFVLLTASNAYHFSNQLSNSRLGINKGQKVLIMNFPTRCRRPSKGTGG